MTLSLRKCILLFVFLTVNTLNLLASQLGSLIASYQKSTSVEQKAQYLLLMSERLNQSNSDTIAPYLQIFENLIKEHGLKQYYIPLYFAKSEHLFYQGKYDESLKLLRSILPKSNKKFNALINNLIGEILINQTKYSDAIDILLKNERFCLENNDSKSLVLTYNLLGMLNHRLNRMNRALQYFRLCIKHSEQTKNYKMLASTYENASVIYTELNEHDSSMLYLLRCIYYNKIMSNKIGLASSYNNLSINYFNINKYKEAEHFALLSLSISKESRNYSMYPYCYENLGEIYLKQKDFRKSKYYLDSAISSAIKLKDNLALETAYKYKSIVDTLTSNYKLGLRDYITYKMYTDSIMIKENSQKLIEADLKSDFEKRKEILRLKSESEIQIQKLIRNVLLFIVLIALIFAVILYNQRNKIAIQKQEVEEQKNIIADKSREVLDSIEYAKKIQQAILPSDKAMKSLLPKIFCLYIPKDIVAGDFYWLEKRDRYIYIASCDCTGHGVPGAMVSVVCNNALNRSLNEFHEIDTNKILDRTRSLVLENFSKSESAVLDGMDISLARIDTSSNELMWSGAYSPLWIVRNGDLTIITGDKQPIGNFENYVPFTSHTIKLESNDSIYLFSDGYCDQFGGPNDKKFSKARLKPLIEECSKLSPSDQYKLLYNTHLNWRGNQTQIDDITIIGFSIS